MSGQMYLLCFFRKNRSACAIAERPARSTTVPPTTEPVVTGKESNGLAWWVFGAIFGAIILGGGVILALRTMRRRPGQP